MVTEEAEYSYPQDDFDHEEATTTTPLQIYHAPYSLLHLESTKTPGANEVNFRGAHGCFLPETKEIKQEQLEESIQKSISLLPSGQKQALRSIYDTLPKEQRLYGEYLPQTALKSNKELNGNASLEGKSVDSIKYVTNFLLQKNLEKNGRQQEIVFHPDILFFSSKGRIENVHKVLNYFNNIARVLNQKIFIENISLSNKTFENVLGMFQSPKEIYALLKPFSNFGVVVDLQHLEKSGERISLGDIKEISYERLIIHSRKGYRDKYNDIYTHAAKNAVPWIIEE